MHKAIVIGTSAGGIEALKHILPRGKKADRLPIIIVIHMGGNYSNNIPGIFENYLKTRIKEADDKETIESGAIYFAPNGYHLQIEKDESFSLSIEEKINFSRPSIDILFETAAETYQEKLIGILLTGSNGDGSKGMEKIFGFGGKVIIQNPESAYAPQMTAEALKKVPNVIVWTLEEIKEYLKIF